MKYNDLNYLAVNLLNGLDSRESQLSMPQSVIDPCIISLADSEYKCNTKAESLVFLSRDVYKECTYRMLANK